MQYTKDWKNQITVRNTIFFLHRTFIGLITFNVFLIYQFTTLALQIYMSNNADENQKFGEKVTINFHWQCSQRFSVILLIWQDSTSLPCNDTVLTEPRVTMVQWTYSLGKYTTNCLMQVGQLIEVVQRVNMFCNMPEIELEYQINQNHNKILERNWTV